MIKKILPISIFVLVLVFIVLIGLQMMLNKKGQSGTSSITPTMVQGKQGSYAPQTGKSSPSSGTSSQGSSSLSQSLTNQMTAEELQKDLPIVASDFTLDYSPRMQKYVVTLKTDNGQAAYDQWVGQNQSLAPLLPAEQVVVAHQTVAELNDALDYAEKNKQTPEQEFKKNTDTLLNIVNTLFSPIALPTGTVEIPTSIPNPSSVPTEKPQTNSGSGNYTYYAQCDPQYGNYPLPVQNGANGQKCTECNAGCGPTTAAMIISSYVDSTQTPPKVIDSMGKAGVSISCSGSGIYELYGYMSKVDGIKVSSIMSLGHAKASEVASDFKNYIGGGWTIFALADCIHGGHYFWITDVTTDGKILAFDPAYGAGRPTPFDENQYDPYPYYVYAFAVKKS